MWILAYSYVYLNDIKFPFHHIITNMLFNYLLSHKQILISTHTCMFQHLFRNVPYIQYYTHRHTFFQTHTQKHTFACTNTLIYSCTNSHHIIQITNSSDIKQYRNAHIPYFYIIFLTALSHYYLINHCVLTTIIVSKVSI